VSGQVPVASSVSDWAEEGAERPGVESCLGRACVCVQHQNTLCSFFAVVCRLSMERQESQKKEAPAASDTGKRRAGRDNMDVCFYLAAAAAAACVALLTDPGGQSGDLVAPVPSAVCTFPQFVCPQPAEESQSSRRRAQPEGI
jgi:hypothetical protein